MDHLWHQLIVGVKEDGVRLLVGQQETVAMAHQAMHRARRLHGDARRLERGGQVDREILRDRDVGNQAAILFRDPDKGLLVCLGVRIDHAGVEGCRMLLVVDQQDRPVAPVGRLIDPRPAGQAQGAAIVALLVVNLDPPLLDREELAGPVPYG